MCKPNGKAGIPAACPRRGDCRGCRMLLSAMAGERSASRLDVLIKEVRPLPAPVFLETCLKLGNPMPIPKSKTL
ncbi:hypothetical protein NE852_17340 [Rhizobium sp. Pop5]|uniref:hypothetical protein n=1 Tax=Rhizobium sp. Pop5 TaxID=1223565 RepID=UPI0002834CDA|nr:hypothetical protein [Rhizobium sp. Pop5]EJZ17662.1 hypothetical protein RCCGEPOP_29569 [Rhizobium sp. Pop5]UVD55843.1 hypothetical protein NE852_17340 [Rhizobium sp. Pop5]